MRGFPNKGDLDSTSSGGNTIVQFSSVSQLCPTLCDPMNCSTPGFPVHHQFPELTQTHVHRLCDAIQPSYPLSSPSIFPSISVFSNESVLRIRWPKYCSFSFNISPCNEYLARGSARLGCCPISLVASHLRRACRAALL